MFWGSKLVQPESHEVLEASEAAAGNAPMKGTCSIEASAVRIWSGISAAWADVVAAADGVVPVVFGVPVFGVVLAAEGVKLAAVRTGLLAVGM